MKTLIIAIAFVMALAGLCSAEEGEQEKEGLFSKGSFLSDAISSVTGKFDTMASGGEKIVSKDAKGLPEDTLAYDSDPLGRPLPKPSFRKKGKQNVEETE